MSQRRPFDPLNCIPSAAVVEKALREAEGQARKLRILLDVARQVEGQKAAAAPVKPAPGQEASRASS